MGATTAKAVPTSGDWKRNLDTETLGYLGMDPYPYSKEFDETVILDMLNCTPSELAHKVLMDAEFASYDVRVLAAGMVLLYRSIQARGMEISETVRRSSPKR